MQTETYKTIVKSARNTNTAREGASASSDAQSVSGAEISPLPEAATAHGEGEEVSDDDDVESDSPVLPPADSLSPQQRALALMTPVFEKIPPQTLLPLNMPVRVQVAEAEALLLWMQQDKSQLVQRGFEWQQVAELSQAAMALKEAQSNWDNVRYMSADAQKAWQELLKKAIHMRSELLHFMRFAYAQNTDLVERIVRIGEGVSSDDVIQDLNDISLLGRNNLAPLAALGITAEQLLDAANLSDALSKHKAAAQVQRKLQNQKKLLRDQAYTYVTGLIKTIRQYGQLVFWRTPDRLKGYSSDFLRAKNRRKNTTDAEKEAPKSDTPEAPKSDDLPIDPKSNDTPNTPPADAPADEPNSDDTPDNPAEE